MLRRATLLIMICFLPGLVFGADIFIHNPETGNLERIWEAPDRPNKPADAQRTAIFWQEETGPGIWTEPERVSLPGHDCFNAGVAIDTFGNRYVVYEWHGPFTQIHLRSKGVDEKPGKWSPVIHMSPENYDFLQPGVAVKNKLFVSYNGDGTVLLQVGTPNDWDPWDPVLELETNVPDPDGQLHSGTDSSGETRVWLDYVYDDSTLRWMEPEDDDASRSAVREQTIIDGNVEAARASVEKQILQ